MLSPVIFLILNGLFFTLRLSGGGGSFPRPLKPEEEREYLERWAKGDMEARNVLISGTCAWSPISSRSITHRRGTRTT